jgi:hypothetical protein
VSVAVDANYEYWQFYTGGIVDAADCLTEFNHEVLIVGYDLSFLCVIRLKTLGEAEWGLQGYINIAIVDGEGTCGI